MSEALAVTVAAFAGFVVSVVGLGVVGSGVFMALLAALSTADGVARRLCAWVRR